MNREPRSVCWSSNDYISVIEISWSEMLVSQKYLCMAEFDYVGQGNYELSNPYSTTLKKKIFGYIHTNEIDKPMN